MIYNVYNVHDCSHKDMEVGETPLRDQQAQWALKFKVPHTSVGDLLNILKPHHAELLRYWRILL